MIGCRQQDRHGSHRTYSGQHSNERSQENPEKTKKEVGGLKSYRKAVSEIIEDFQTDLATLRLDLTAKAKVKVEVQV